MDDISTIEADFTILFSLDMDPSCFFPCEQGFQDIEKFNLGKVSEKRFRHEKEEMQNECQGGIPAISKAVIDNYKIFNHFNGSQ